MSIENFNIAGLTQQEVVNSRNLNGSNTLDYKKKNEFLASVNSIIKEPMVLLLLIASVIYFIGGKPADAVFLACAIVLVSAISLYQDSKTRMALEKLKEYTKPTSKVIRDAKLEEIKSEEVVVGDSLVIEEGSPIAADGVIVHSNDFSVNESILTGESLAVFKSSSGDNKLIYRGTIVTSGLAIATVTAIGNKTRLGKIGKSLEAIKEEKTPLELQIGNFVKMMALAGAGIFLLVWAINFYRSFNLPDSLLKSLTLAMSILPEEIPVAFTTFMALGAWRMMQMGVVVKQMKTVETLGSATVICVDKTGTLTENRMEIAKLFAFESMRTVDPEERLEESEKELIELGMWSSEPIPFDPMEVALHNRYEKMTLMDRRPSYKMAHEYPLEGKPPMMTHIFENAYGKRIIAAKGAPEALLNTSALSMEERVQIEGVMKELASKGYRILGVGEAKYEGREFPGKQQDFKFNFKGLIAFYDPPKKNIQAVLKQFYAAGISVKIITGDNELTTKSIARQVAFKGSEKYLDGPSLMALSDIELQKEVVETNIFTRMFPEAKLRIIRALKANKEIVAMTGDGLNDGPALKAAHIGIAMGKRGTEIAKQAASLILLEDDLSKMVDAVAMGRKIYTNLKRAIQYIISIHIPIILTVFIPLVLGWVYPNLFSPVHIVFFELIMGPTCSIIYENEPIAKDTMLLKPRAFSTTFFNWKEIMTSVVQGLVIAIGSLTIYQYSIYFGFSEAVTRTMVFTVLISANIFLTLVNRSFYDSILTTLKFKNNLVFLIIGITVLISGLLLYVKPFMKFFEFEKLNPAQLMLSIAVGFFVVIWYELFKWRKRSLNTDVSGKGL